MRDMKVAKLQKKIHNPLMQAMKFFSAHFATFIINFIFKIIELLVKSN